MRKSYLIPKCKLHRLGLRHVLCVSDEIKGAYLQQLGEEGGAGGSIGSGDVIDGGSF